MKYVVYWENGETSLMKFDNESERDSFIKTHSFLRISNGVVKMVKVKN